MVRWKCSEMAGWEKWKSSEVARWERWESDEVGRWEVPGFTQVWETQGQSKTFTPVS